MPDTVTDARVSDALSEYVHEELDGKERFFAGIEGQFEVACNEDAGYGDDDAPLVVRRRSDGALFAVQLRAVAVPVPDAAGREKAIAALPGDCCWILVRPCGCPVAVTTARQGKLVHAPTEAEALMSVYAEDWARAERDRQAGYRIALVTWDRYREDYAPRFGKCEHEGQPALPGLEVA